MKVLLAASEVAPIVKIGGLGDVIGSLPKALRKLGVKADVVVPFYSTIKTDNLQIYKSHVIDVDFNGETNPVDVYKTRLPDSEVWVFMLKNDKYLAAGGVSYYARTVSETEMFSFFDSAIVELVKSAFNTYDVIHCNDWHTGMVTHLLEQQLGYERPATLFTIHNLMYQGVGDDDIVREVGIVPGEHPLIDWDIADGDLNMMQQGVTSADFVNTVSPTYAQEILTPKFGGSLVDILKAREGRLCGILNGIDYAAFPRGYDAVSWQIEKPKMREALVRKCGLTIDADCPIFSFIGRIDPNQKGLDILFDAVPEIIKGGGAFILLGSGDKVWEEKYMHLAEDASFSGKIACINKFDPDLANLIYSGSDFLVIPSKYEPCGLIQMIAMWYGTIPIVHAVGGLKDTVIDYVNGLVFDRYTAEALIDSVRAAFETYKSKDTMTDLVTTAMTQNFDWTKSAIEYAKLYERIIELRKAA